jgi:hypothetical protein
MSETKGERRAEKRRKDRQGMRVTGKYFWRAIANSQSKRDQERTKGEAKPASPLEPPAPST